MNLQPQVQWTTPPPLWSTSGSQNGSDPSAFKRPSILRFASDTFMDDYLALLSRQPDQLSIKKAVPEIWRGTPPENEPLTLYQPAHQRYYLLTAGLVCKVQGLPDRHLATDNSEEIYFVVRRLVAKPGKPAVPPALSNLDDFNEYAFIAADPNSDTPYWRKLEHQGAAVEKTAVTGEERLPLFGVSYTASRRFGQDQRRLALQGVPPAANIKETRRVLSGLIPASKRETYLGAPLSDGPAAAGEGVSPVVPAGFEAPLAAQDPRLAYFYSQVLSPWYALIDRYNQDAAGRARVAVLEPLETAGTLSEDQEEELEILRQMLAATRRGIVMGSWYILLDLADFLTAYLPDGQEPIYALLGDYTSQGINLRTVLENITSHRDRLEGATMSHQFQKMGPILAYKPDSGPLSYAFVNDPDAVTVAAGWPEGVLLSDVPALTDEADDDFILQAIADALPTAVPAGAPALPLAARTALFEPAEDGWFVIRCGFEKPGCVLQPNPVISKPTEPFQLASFFDVEAPSRPVRISLPLDISPAGLRKFDKNAALILSDVLACQVDRVRKITFADLVLSVLPWPFHKDLPDPSAGDCGDPSSTNGMVCSLSIPIVTICALILLIIIVALFDTFFKWIPYLIACFPIPGLKGKK